MHSNKVKIGCYYSVSSVNIENHRYTSIPNSILLKCKCDTNKKSPNPKSVPMALEIEVINYVYCPYFSTSFTSVLLYPISLSLDYYPLGKHCRCMLTLLNGLSVDIGVVRSL